jgi:hypothetical protein
MMEESLLTGSQNLLHNSGGPRSRTRTEKVERSMISHVGIISHSEVLCLEIPDIISDPKIWLLELAFSEGFSEFENLDRELDLPRDKMVVTPVTDPVMPARTTREMLRAALILSRTNGQRYLPGGPCVFTRHRLNRTIRLVHINLNVYYEMD